MFCYQHNHTCSILRYPLRLFLYLPRTRFGENEFVLWQEVLNMQLLKLAVCCCFYSQQSQLSLARCLSSPCPLFTASLAFCILRSRLINQILINLCGAISSSISIRVQHQVVAVGRAVTVSHTGNRFNCIITSARSHPLISAGSHSCAACDLAHDILLALTTLDPVLLTASCTSAVVWTIHKYFKLNELCICPLFSSVFTDLKSHHHADDRK